MLQVSVAPRSGEKRRRDTMTTPAPKRSRFLSDFDLEEMMCTVMTICEDLGLLLNLTKDICEDKHCCLCDPADRVRMHEKLRIMENALSHDTCVSLYAIQSMCKDIYDVLKYILEKHYVDFAKLGMDHLVLAVRHQFIQFMVDYSLN
ncbi:hypothetical protein ACHHYP_17364 [Achlya hypogyna]|uniref:Uncharacterized protein n=1 Tax=Achlya hypogyna TaxID=1202772 RepID=A0A1V9Y4M1_ACHHY|nr:hypothetical protein ACHHYP_17364 [Achlya hypogyna]